MKRVRNKLTLDQPATYQIVVLGEPGPKGSEGIEMALTVERGGEGPPRCTLTGTVVDQAALQGLLGRLYALGLPLISLICLEDPSKGEGRE